LTPLAVPARGPVDRPGRTKTATAALDFERRRLLVLIGAGALAIAAGLALADLAGYEALLRALQRLDPQWLAVCFAGQVVAYFGYILAVRDVACVEDGPTLPFGLTTRTVIAGFGVFAATQAAGGFVVDFWALRRSGVRRDEALRRVLTLGALEYAVLAPAAMVCAILLLLQPGHKVQDGMTWPWLLVIPAALAALWFSQPKRRARLSRLRGGRVVRSFAHGVAAVGTLRSLMTTPRHMLGVVGVSLYWAGDIATLWASLQVFGADISTTALVVAYASAYVLTRRSLPAGGAGIVEVLMTFALVWVGIKLAPALLAVVVYRLFNFWLPVVPALAALPGLRRAQRRPVF
jgi:uncharacterized membrane protein YbhN (UPF0104 family)